MEIIHLVAKESIIMKHIGSVNRGKQTMDKYQFLNKVSLQEMQDHWRSHKIPFTKLGSVLSSLLLLQERLDLKISEGTKTFFPFLFISQPVSTVITYF